MLDELRERLLREGVKPGVVRRYVAELRDHLDDMAVPREEALRRIGSPEVLAAALLAQPGVRSWTARVPWATLVLGPVLGFLLGCFVPSLLLFLGVRDYGLMTGDLPVTASKALIFFNEYLLPILIGWTAVAVAVRQRASMGWLLAGVVVIAIGGGGLIEGISWSGNNFGFGFQLADPFTTVLGRSLETGLFNLIAILAPYAAARMRMARAA
jgi:hypothetical protein